MSLLNADSFALYATPADAIAGSVPWTSGNTGTALLNKTSRFGYGQSIALDAPFDHLNFAGSDNQPMIGFTFAYMSVGSNQFYIAIEDGSTVQCSIMFDGTAKTISLIQGPTLGGTVLATWSSAFVANSFDNYQFQVIINNAAGEFHIRKNGATSDSFAATGLNTRGGTSNNYANSFQIASNSAQNYLLQDWIAYNGNTASWPSNWTGDVHFEIKQPISDTAQKQFTQSTSGGASLSFNTKTGTVAASQNPNTLYIDATAGTNVATQGGLLTSATVTFNASFIGNAQLGIYLLDGNVAGNLSDSLPGTLVGTSAVVNNPSATQVFTFSNVPIKKGFAYGVGLLADSAFTAKGSNSITGKYYTTGVAYIGGFPDSLRGVSPDGTYGVGIQFSATLTATNAGCVNDETEDGTTTMLIDSVPGDFDLFNLEPLLGLPPVYGIQLRAFLSKSDAGGRGFEIAAKSGATSFSTNPFSPTTSFTNCAQFYPNDPNTGLPWIAAAVNALQIGPKVSS